MIESRFPIRDLLQGLCLYAAYFFLRTAARVGPPDIYRTQIQDLLEHMWNEGFNVRQCDGSRFDG